MSGTPGCSPSVCQSELRTLLEMCMQLVLLAMWNEYRLSATNLSLPGCNFLIFKMGSMMSSGSCCCRVKQAHAYRWLNAAQTHCALPGSAGSVPAVGTRPPALGGKHGDGAWPGGSAMFRKLKNRKEQRATKGAQRLEWHRPGFHPALSLASPVGMKQIHGDRKEHGGCQGLGRGRAVNI